MGTPSVAGIVLTWNEYPDTAECLRSLQAQSYPDLRIVLVDNGSTDGSIDRLEAEFPDIRTIRRDTNDGFAAGVNDGIQTVLDEGVELVWLFNNDVIVPDGVLERLVERFASNDGIGVIAPKMMQYPDTDAPWFTQGLIDRRSGAQKHGERVLDPALKRDALVYNDYIPFTCTLIRSAVFEDVGLLPERYFIYGEDTEFGDMVTAEGYDLVTDTDVEIYHKENVTTGGPLVPFFTYYIARNRWLFVRQFDEVDWQRFVSSYLLWFLKVTALSARHLKLGNVWAVIRGTVDGVRQKDGKGPY